MSDLFENKGYIYESPDGGDTVYRRLPGTNERELLIDKPSMRDQILEDKLWGEIRRMAKKDEGLQELLDRAIVYYNLKRDHDR